MFPENEMQAREYLINHSEKELVDGFIKIYRTTNINVYGTRTNEDFINRYGEGIFNLCHAYLDLKLSDIKLSRDDFYPRLKDFLNVRNAKNNYYEFVAHNCTETGKYGQDDRTAFREIFSKLDENSRNVPTRDAIIWIALCLSFDIEQELNPLLYCCGYETLQYNPRRIGRYYKRENLIYRAFMNQEAEGYGKKEKLDDLIDYENHQLDYSIDYLMLN